MPARSALLFALAALLAGCQGKDSPDDSALDDTGVTTDDSAADDSATDDSATDDSAADDSAADDSAADDSAAVDDADGDGFNSDVDCEDTDPSVNPGAEEICGDGVDNDCDEDPTDCTFDAEVAADDADLRWQGSAGQELGGPVRSLGDVTGDGLPDIAFGARGDDDGGEDAGAVYLSTSFHDQSGLITPDIKLTGAAAGDETYAVWPLGDINGDGHVDLAVGAKSSDLAFEDAGAVYLLHGPIQAGGALLDIQDLLITGEAAGDQFGVLSRVGDLTGDGFDDILVGAPRNSAGGERAGAVYLYAGPSDPNHVPTAIIRGDEAGAQLGGGLAGVGDVNGDGRPDLAVSAPYLDGPAGEDSGVTYLILDPLEGEVSAAEVASATINGAQANDQLGWGVSSAQDHDGDGYDDLLINAQRADRDGYSGNEGLIVLILGSGEGLQGERSSADADSFLFGLEDDDRLSAASGDGDVDGDGNPDLLIGSRYFDESNADAGAAWLVLGPIGSGRQELRVISEARFSGVDEGDGFGAHLGFVPDANGDGADELLLSARWDDAGGEDAGEASLFFGRVQ